MARSDVLSFPTLCIGTLRGERVWQQKVACWLYNWTQKCYKERHNFVFALQINRILVCWWGMVESGCRTAQIFANKIHFLSCFPTKYGVRQYIWMFEIHHMYLKFMLHEILYNFLICFDTEPNFIDRVELWWLLCHPKFLLVIKQHKFFSCLNNNEGLTHSPHDIRMHCKEGTTG